jgi:YgiT-type zinc finger domain-containing protein
MTCENCGQPGARTRCVPRTYGKGQSLLVIKDVPVVFCASCGESYMESETLTRIEQIKRKRKQLAAKQTVAVAVFD